jgi:protease-4
MKRILIGLLAAVGALTLLLVAVAMFLGLIATWAPKAQLPKVVLLEMDLSKPLLPAPQEVPWTTLLEPQALTLADALDALEVAAQDSRVRGILLKLSASPPGGLATAQELRTALQEARNRGKKVFAFGDTIGEFRGAFGGYYLATVADRIFLQPSGDVGLTGLLLESMFVAGTLEKLGMRARMDHRYEYKNAMNTFTEKRFTPAHREALEALGRSFYEQLVEGIATGRGMSLDEVRRKIDNGPYYGTEALEAGLVDELAYEQEALDRIREILGTEFQRLSLRRYLQANARPHQKGTAVAWIYGVGGVARGKSGFDPLTGESTMGSETVARAFRDAIEDSDVRAIIFRVDSPGGSYVASDTIWRETQRAREKGKPVVVTMGDVAASGGYFVSMGADRILAQPGTITGSIGVLAGKILTQGFWEKLGISWDEVHFGETAKMWSGLSDYSPKEWQRFQTALDRIYLDFTTKAAQGRKMSQERLHAIAKGRVWSGADALRLGLIDGLGGRKEALAAVRELLQLPADAPLELRPFPKPRKPIEVLLARLQGEEETEAEVGLRESAWLSALRPVVKLVRLATQAGNPDEALRAPVSVEAGKIQLQ